MIYLYGKLRKEFGPTINCKVSSIQELLKAAEANRPGFTAAIEKDRGYVIRRGSDFRTAKEVVVTEKELESKEYMQFGEDDWHILPMPMGYSGVARVIVGVVLIVVGAVVSYVGFGIGTPIMKLGAVILVSGVASMLAPSPSVAGYGDRESPDQRPSYLFDGPTNRVEPGGAVPLVYGFDVIIGSIFTSGSLKIGDIV